MHSFRETRVMPYDARFIYDIVMDIEKYPQFLPWCSSATILLKKKEYLTAKLAVEFKNFSKSYVSKVFSHQTPEGYNIEVQAISGPFRYLKNIWQIKSLNNASEVKFSIDFEFKSSIIDMLIGVVFSTATEKMIVAFEARAKELSIN